MGKIKSAINLLILMQVLNIGPFWFVLLPLFVGSWNGKFETCANFFMISRLRERGGFSLHELKHIDIVKLPQFKLR